MLVEFERRADKDKYEPVFINPSFVVTVVASYKGLYKDHTTIMTCGRFVVEENEWYIVKGTPHEVAAKLHEVFKHNG